MENKNEVNYDEILMTIKLKKWQIVELLEGLRMGIWVKGWDAALTQSSIQTYDKYSYNWIYRVGIIIDEIRKQTGTSRDYAMSSDSYHTAELINKFISEKCTKIEKKHLEMLKAEFKFEIQTNYDSEKRPCAVCGWEFEPIVGNMLFIEGSRMPVCSRCSEKLAPEMLKEIEKIEMSDDLPD